MYSTLLGVQEGHLHTIMGLGKSDTSLFSLYALTPYMLLKRHVYFIIIILQILKYVLIYIPDSKDRLLPK